MEESLNSEVSFPPSAQLVPIPRGNLISSSDGIYPGNAKLFPLLLGNEGGGFSVAVGRTSGGRFISLAEIIWIRFRNFSCGPESEHNQPEAAAAAGAAAKPVIYRYTT